MTWIIHVENLRTSESIDLERDGAWEWLESEIQCLIPGETMTIIYEGDGDADPEEEYEEIE